MPHCSVNFSGNPVSFYFLFRAKKSATGPFVEMRRKVPCPRDLFPGYGEHGMGRGGGGGQRVGKDVLSTKQQSYW